MKIRDELIALAEDGYRDFTASLMPTVDKQRVMGVRTPRLRALARSLKGSDEAREFLRELPHAFYEENNLHGFLMCDIKDFDECISEVERFLPFVDNWATCDGLRPRCFKRNTERLLPHIKEWLASEHTYTVRFGIEMLMCYYLDEAFRPEYLHTVAGIESEEYYVRMMQAWYFATALAKRWEETIPYLERQRLTPWVHNKTVQKAIESYRVSAEQKEYLKTLRR